MKPSLGVFSEAATVTAPDAFPWGPEVADGSGSQTLGGGAPGGRAGGQGRNLGGAGAGRGGAGRAARP